MRHSQEDVNALRAVARKAISDINAAIKSEIPKGIDKKKTRKMKDEIQRRVFLDCEKRISPKFTLMELFYYVGVMTGQLEDKG